LNGPGADEHYWQALREGRLELQQCAGCARWNWPAVWRCGECGSWEHRWHEVPLSGTIFTWTRTWHEFGAAKEFELPFVSVVVELDGAGHRRVMGTLADRRDDVRIGARVTGNISRVTIDGESVPALVWKMGATK
jgi:uncharacterized protein